MAALRLICAIFIAALPGALCAQNVVHHPNPGAALAERWAWAISDGCSRDCWVGYGIHRMMDVNSYTGWYSSHRHDHPTLQSIVYGREVEPAPSKNRHDHDVAGARQMVMKEVAMLFRIDARTKAISDVKISNISLPVDLDELPLVWMGRAEQPQSIRLLKDQYGRAKPVEIKEDLVSAVGMHDAADLVLPFLRDVLASKEHEDVREQAVFWIAEIGDPAVLPLLERTARNDASEEIREQAVFGISRIETEAADELLIDLARNLNDSETREQAIFWLGQKASEKAAANLEDIAENDPNVEIQKKAVFAISQLPEDEGIPRLISIAKTHRNRAVRHDAIFWLGESGDPRAVDVLVDIVRGN